MNNSEFDVVVEVGKRHDLHDGSIIGDSVVQPVLQGITHHKHWEVSVQVVVLIEDVGYDLRKGNLVFLILSSLLTVTMEVETTALVKNSI